MAINTPEGMARLARCTRYTYGAPAALVVCYDREAVWVRNYDGKDSGDVDASIVTTQMMLEAADLGVGTCWVGHFDPVAIREQFDMPESFVPVAVQPWAKHADAAEPIQAGIRASFPVSSAAPARRRAGRNAVRTSTLP